mmetsp:Transcript_16365/g.26898  ORF Transcript_16365/g.26898 Transcript_16365/m.26898 type:complete len:85 (+) Transcript_16365:595-849(+)
MSHSDVIRSNTSPFHKLEITKPGSTGSCMEEQSAFFQIQYVMLLKNISNYIRSFKLTLQRMRWQCSCIFSQYEPTTQNCKANQN